MSRSTIPIRGQNCRIGPEPLAYVALRDISLEDSLQTRAELNPLWIASIAEAFDEGLAFEPVDLCSPTGRAPYWLCDGWHRYHGALKGGIGTLLARVHVGSFRDAILLAVAANPVPGVHERTDADKRRAVLLLLHDAEWVKWTNSEISRRARVSVTFVGNCRKDVEAELPELASTTRLVMRATGTVHEIHTGKIGKGRLDPVIRMRVNLEKGEHRCDQIYRHIDEARLPADVAGQLIGMVHDLKKRLELQRGSLCLAQPSDAALAA